MFNKYRNEAIAKSQEKPGITRSAPEQTKDKKAAVDFSLKDIKGKTVKLSDLKGKVVILNFWATWCPYCVKEMPELNQAGEEFSKANSAVILAVDVDENPEVVKTFLKKNNITLPVLMDQGGAVANKYLVDGLPTTVIIDKDQNIYKTIVGATDKDTLTGVANELNK